MKTTRPRTIPRNATFQRLWMMGTPRQTIADALGCNPNSLTYVAKQMGLPLRKAGQRRAQ
jgi:hypothetical protein